MKLKISVLSCIAVVVFLTVEGVTSSRSLFFTNKVHHKPVASEGVAGESNQTWNYVNVRPNAHMFWWLYYTTATDGYKNRPLVIWLQGGPGASSTGFGNFQEIGPLDVNLNPRRTTWVSVASLLFIDNPVGTGFSYVTEKSSYTTNVHQIAADLVVVVKAFLKQLPDFQVIPLWIFSESYGGKMTAAFSQALYQEIASGSVKCNFKGLAMGDSWISPVDSIMTWGPYLYSTSLVDENGLNAINDVAQRSADALAQGKGAEATALWGEAEDVTSQVTGGVNVYNILDWNATTRVRTAHGLSRAYELMVGYTLQDALSALMNGPIRKKLGIIPDSVQWGGQSDDVFTYQSEDFMKPVVEIVDYLLNSTDLQVVVYSGQLDLIVDVLGTEKWVQRLKWPGLADFLNSKRSFLTSPSARSSGPLGYVKSYKNFSFYWILNSGHMVPADAGDAALEMLKQIVRAG